MPLGRPVLGLLVGCVAAAVAAPSLRIEVLQGEGANNNAASGATSTIVVRISNANGAVPDALVVFTAPETGAGVTFSGSEMVGQGISDSSGVAISPRLRPVGENGPVEIRVMASASGEIASTIVHQMNLGLGLGDPGELDVEKIPVSGDSSDPAALSLRVRVEDKLGRPVPASPVIFTLRKLEKSGEGQEVLHSVVTTDEQGEAQCEMTRPAGKALRLEWMVRAARETRVATRYFSLD